MATKIVKLDTKKEQLYETERYQKGDLVSLWEYAEGDKLGNNFSEERLALTSHTTKLVRETVDPKQLNPKNIILSTKDGAWDRSEVRCGLSVENEFDYFMAPEVIRNNPTEKSKVYTFGKLLVLILFRWNVAWQILSLIPTEGDLEMLKRTNVLFRLVHALRKMLEVGHMN